MKVTQDSVKAWLSEHRRSREWLANQCGAAKQTINNWLSSPRGIPAKGVLIIEQLMEVDRQQSEAAKKTPQNLVLEFDPFEFDRICNAAAQDAKTPRVWAQDTLNDIANADIKKVAETLRAAEEDLKGYSTSNKKPAAPEADQEP